jgi:hypothetical protein
MDDFVVHPIVQDNKNLIQQFDPKTQDYDWFYFMNISCQKGTYPFATTYMGKFLPDINNGID